MLRVVPSYSAVQAKGYYTHSDYYTEDQELPGLWCGKGCDRLGLSGTIGKKEFDALCDNRHPESGERLTIRDKGKRIVGYDFNFHAPKSVSLLNALMGGNEIQEAFHDSVEETMRLIEADMQTRVRKGKTYSDRTTGNMVWGHFDHLTSRPVEGIPDMHLHSHCFAFNTTFDEKESQWKAGQFRNLKRDAPYFQAVFHSKLANRMRSLGFSTEQTAKGWEVVGFKRETLEKFSRRPLQIEDLAAEKGIEAPEDKAELGAKTREHKAKNLTMSELRRIWSARLDSSEWEVIESLRKRDDLALPITHTAQEALAYACQHLFERNSVVAERKLLAETLAAGLGDVTLEEAKRALKDSDVIVKELGGQRLATTRRVLDEEEKLIAFAKEGRGHYSPLGAANYVIDRKWLNADQQAAVRHVLTSPDRVMMIRGAAGVGKTSLMTEAVEAIEKSGTKVFTFAPSASASRDNLREAGFADADTVARLLVDQKLQEKISGQVLWIDEAGQLGSRSMSKIFALADRLDCRIILSGDRRQHGSVERGAVLRILEEQAGIVAAEVKEIQRQEGDYKQAVKLLSEGRTVEGFDKLDAMGWIEEIPQEERYKTMASDYLASIKEGKSALVVSPTHAEGDKVTATIREALRQKLTPNGKSKLKGEDHTFATLTAVDLTEAQRSKASHYHQGDVIQFHQNATGYKRGERLVVEPGKELPLAQAERFQVFRPGKLSLAIGDRVRITNGGQSQDGHRLENGSFYEVAGFTDKGDIRLNNGWIVPKDYGHLTHGYVVTSYAAQSKSVRRVLVGQSSQSYPASSREQFYVSTSRGRDQVTVYTDDKEALREAIQQSDPRLAATELVRGQRSPRDRLRLSRRRNREREATRHEGRTNVQKKQEMQRE